MATPLVTGVNYRTADRFLNLNDASSRQRFYLREFHLKTQVESRRGSKRRLVISPELSGWASPAAASCSRHFLFFLFVPGNFMTISIKCIKLNSIIGYELTYIPYE